MSARCSGSSWRRAARRAPLRWGAQKGGAMQRMNRGSLADGLGHQPAPALPAGAGTGPGHRATRAHTPSPLNPLPPPVLPADPQAAAGPGVRPRHHGAAAHQRRPGGGARQRQGPAGLGPGRPDRRARNGGRAVMTTGAVYSSSSGGRGGSGRKNVKRNCASCFRGGRTCRVDRGAGGHSAGLQGVHRADRGCLVSSASFTAALTTLPLELRGSSANAATRRGSLNAVRPAARQCCCKSAGVTSRCPFVPVFAVRLLPSSSCQAQPGRSTTAAATCSARRVGAGKGGDWHSKIAPCASPTRCGVDPSRSTPTNPPSLPAASVVGPPLPRLRLQGVAPARPPPLPRGRFRRRS